MFLSTAVFNQWWFSVPCSNKAISQLTCRLKDLCLQILYSTQYLQLAVFKCPLHCVIWLADAWGLLFSVYTCREWGSELECPGILGWWQWMRKEGHLAHLAESLCCICKQRRNVQRPLEIDKWGFKTERDGVGCTGGLLSLGRRKT